MSSLSLVPQLGAGKKRAKSGQVKPRLLPKKGNQKKAVPRPKTSSKKPADRSTGEKCKVTPEEGLKDVPVNNKQADDVGTARESAEKGSKSATAQANSESLVDSGTKSSTPSECADKQGNATSSQGSVPTPNNPTKGTKTQSGRSISGGSTGRKGGEQLPKKTGKRITPGAVPTSKPRTVPVPSKRGTRSSSRIVIQPSFHGEESSKRDSGAPADNTGASDDAPAGTSSTSSKAGGKGSTSLVPFPGGSSSTAGTDAPFSTGALPPKVPGAKTMADFCSRYESAEKKSRGRKRGPRKKKGDADDMKEALAKRKKKADTESDGKDQVNGDAASAEAGAPIVEIINGEIVVRESSLMVDVNSRRTIQEINAELGNEVVEEEGATQILTATYNSFTNRDKIKRWDVESTKLFYHALRQCGTDFSLMEQYFEGNRTRRQLKRKYLTENRQRPALIDLAMRPTVQTSLDISVFNVTDEDINAMPPPAPVTAVPDDEPTKKEEGASEGKPIVTDDKYMEEVVDETAAEGDEKGRALLESGGDSGTVQNDTAPVPSAVDWLKEFEEEEEAESAHLPKTDGEDDGALEDEFTDKAVHEQPAAPTLSLTGRKTASKKSRGKARVKPKPKAKRPVKKK